MIHVYAITTAPAPLDGLAGVDGVAVELIACGRLHTVTSHHDQPPARRPGQALEHARVVESVMRAVPALPVRFGSWHADERALHAEIERQEESLDARVRRLAYHVEFVVRIVEASIAPRLDVYLGYPGPDAEGSPGQAGIDTGTGSVYLRRRLARERAARASRESARARLDARTAGLADLAIGVSARAGPRGFEVAYLVEAGEAEHFGTLAEAAVAADRSLLLGGPWPPYTFAAEPAHAS